MDRNSRQPPVNVAYSDEEGGDTDDNIAYTTSDVLPRVETPIIENDVATPCSVSGLGSGISAGVMGFVFGGGSQMIRHRGPGRWKTCAAEGMNSAKTFALMGGLYAVVSCISLRLRQKDDAWNGFASGCASGLALSWGGTPMAMAQSSIGFGLFSLAFDTLGARKAAVPPAEAAIMSDLSSSPCLVSAHTSGQRRQGWPLRCNSCRAVPIQRASGADLQSDVPPPLMEMMLKPCFSQPLLTPAAMWLQPLQAAATQHVQNRLSGLRKTKAV